MTTPPGRTARDIAIVLSVKLLALGALYALFFGPSRQVRVTPDAVEHRLLVPATPSPIRE